MRYGTLARSRDLTAPVCNKAVVNANSLQIVVLSFTLAFVPSQAQDGIGGYPLAALDSILLNPGVKGKGMHMLKQLTALPGCDAALDRCHGGVEAPRRVYEKQVVETYKRALC